MSATPRRHAPTALYALRAVMTASTAQPYARARSRHAFGEPFAAAADDLPPPGKRPLATTRRIDRLPGRDSVWTTRRRPDRQGRWRMSPNRTENEGATSRRAAPRHHAHCAQTEATLPGAPAAEAHTPSPNAAAAAAHAGGLRAASESRLAVQGRRPPLAPTARFDGTARPTAFVRAPRAPRAASKSQRATC